MIGDMNFLWVNQLKRWEKTNRSIIPDDEWCGRKKIKSNIIVHFLHVCNCTKHHMNLSFKAPHRSLRQNHFSSLLHMGTQVWRYQVTCPSTFIVQYGVQIWTLRAGCWSSYSFCYVIWTEILPNPGEATAPTLGLGGEPRIFPHLQWKPLPKGIAGAVWSPGHWAVRVV